MEVVFTSYDGYLYVLRGSNGTLLWNTYVGYPHYSYPRVYNINGIPGQEVVVATDYGTYAFNGTTCSLVWSNTSLTSSAAVTIADLENNGDIEIIVADNAGYVVALRGTDGSIMWSVSSTCGGYGSAPAVEDVNGDGIKLYL